jgi:hypothetical protein
MLGRANFFDAWLRERSIKRKYQKTKGLYFILEPGIQICVRDERSLKWRKTEFERNLSITKRLLSTAKRTPGE